MNFRMMATFSALLIILYSNDAFAYYIQNQISETTYNSSESNMIIHPSYCNPSIITCWGENRIYFDAPWRINPNRQTEVYAVINKIYDIKRVIVYDDINGNVIAEKTFDDLLSINATQIPYLINFSIDTTGLSRINNRARMRMVFTISLLGIIYNQTEGPIEILLSDEPIPTFKNWYYGDTHYHSSYTQNEVEIGGPLPATMKSIDAVGLDWITVTDHSFTLKTDAWWNVFKGECSSYPNCLIGEEISCDNDGPGDYNHYLGYDLTNRIYSGEFLDNAVSPLQCSDVVNRVISQGGFGYVAHPFYREGYDNGGLGLTYRNVWQNYSLPFVGMEIWNIEDRIDELEQGLNKWNELLLSGRKVFIEGGSDAHGDFNRDEYGSIGTGMGKVRTSCYAPSFSKANIFSALKNGNCFMTDGPALKFEVSGKILGETADACQNMPVTLEIAWNSTSEFGSVDNITVVTGEINGSAVSRRIISIGSFSGAQNISLTPERDTFVYLEAFTNTGKRAYTNPLWLKIDYTDTDNDTICNVLDPDDDNDGTPDVLEKRDWCRTVPGPVCNRGCPDTAPPMMSSFYITLPGSVNTPDDSTIFSGKTTIHNIIEDVWNADYEYSIECLDTPEYKLGPYDLRKMSVTDVLSPECSPWMFSPASVSPFMFVPQGKCAYEVIDTALIPDGVYTLYLKANDTTGNLAEDAFNITIDNTPPEISGLKITAHNDSAEIIFATSEAGYASVEYGDTPNYGKMLKENRERDAPRIMHGFSLKPLNSSATYYFRINVSDTLSNTKSTNSTFKTSSLLVQPVNFTDSSIFELNSSSFSMSIMSTNNKSADLKIEVAEGNPGWDGFRYVNISGNISSEGIGFAFLKIYYTEEEIAAKGLPESGLAIYWLNESSGEWVKAEMGVDGFNDAGVDVEENYVWVNVSHFSVYGLFGDSSSEANVPPVNITIQSPENKTYNTNMISLNATFEGAAETAWLSIDGGVGQNYTQNATNLALNLGGLSDGSHNASIFANNSLGNVTSQTVIFVVDITPPALSLSVAPSAIYAGQTTTISCLASDNTEITTSTLAIIKPSAVIVPASCGQPFYDTTMAGTYTATYSATDTAGNFASVSKTFTVYPVGGGGGGKKDDKKEKKKDKEEKEKPKKPDKMSENKMLSKNSTISKNNATTILGAKTEEKNPGAGEKITGLVPAAHASAFSAIFETLRLVLNAVFQGLL